MNHTDPKYIGPGYWASFHRRSIYADTEDKKDEIARSIIIDIQNFPCDKCRKHAIEYLKSHSITDAIKNKSKDSLFKWTVHFHNHVNKSLGKEIINIEQAYNMWSNEGKGICYKNCGEDDEVLSNNEQIKRYELFLISNY